MAALAAEAAAVAVMTAGEVVRGSSGPRTVVDGTSFDDDCCAAGAHSTTMVGVNTSLDWSGSRIGPWSGLMSDGTTKSAHASTMVVAAAPNGPHRVG